MAGWLIPSIPSYFFLSFLPFFSTLYIRIALLSPFRKTSLSLSFSRSDERRRSLFFPPSLSLQHFPLSCSHFSRAKEEAKWEMGVQKCAGGGREASDSRREGLDKQTCAVSERTAAQIPRRTPRRPRLFSRLPRSGPQRHVCRSHTPSSSSLDFEGERATETESATTTLHVPVIHLRRRRSQRRRRQPRHIISVCQPHGAKRTCPALPLSWQCCAPSNANMESVLASRLSSTLPVGRPARAPPSGPLLAVVRCRLRRRQRG